MDLDSLANNERNVLDAARELTEHQLRIAKDIVAHVNHDMKINLPLETVGAVVQALSTNFAALIVSRHGLGSV